MSGDNIVVDTSLIINLFNGVEEVQSLITGRNFLYQLFQKLKCLASLE